MTINNNFAVNQVTRISKSMTNLLATKDQQYLIDNFDNIKAFDLVLNNLFGVHQLKICSFLNSEKGLGFEITDVSEFLALDNKSVSEMFNLMKQVEKDKAERETK